MTNWQSEMQELIGYYESLRDGDGMLPNELSQLVNALDEDTVLVRARRTLEVIVNELCNQELQGKQKTGPLAKLISRLELKNILPKDVVASMYNINKLGTFGAHPKPTNGQEVGLALPALKVVLGWYVVKYKGIDKLAEGDERLSGKESNPYKGLDAFEEKDADRYFGRERLLEETLWPAFQALATAPSRLMALVGPSGSGKSSLARAGLLPLLKRQLPACRLLVTTPTAHPLNDLALILAQLAQPEEPFPAGKQEEFRKQLAADDNQGLLRAADLFYKRYQAPLILLVDQFEEVFTLCKNIDNERNRYLDNLLTAISDPAPHFYLLLTLRSDFLNESQSYPAFNQVLSRQAHLVPVLDDDGLRRAITVPAKRAGRALDEGAVQLLIEQSKNQEGALPLLQSALSKIWEGLRHGQSAPETLRKIGGVGGALAGQAQSIYQNLSEDEQQITQRSFLKLVQLGEGSPDSKRRVLLDDLIAQGEQRDTVRHILRRFAVRDSRFLTFGQDADGQEWVEIVHDALIAHWTELHEWLNASRDDLRLLNRLEADAKHWDANKRAKGLLSRHPDLGFFQSLAAHKEDEFTELQSAFYQASEKEARNLVWFKRSLMGGLICFAVVVSMLWWKAEHQKQEAEHQKQRVEDMFTYSRDAIEDMIQTSDETLTNTPEMELLRKELRKLALNSYQNMSHWNSSEPKIKKALGNATFRMGSFNQQLGESGIEDDYNRAIKIDLGLVIDYPDERQYEIDLARDYDKLGLFQQKIGKIKESLESHRIADSFYKPLVDKDKNKKDSILQSNYASNLDNWGLMELSIGDIEDAKRHYNESLKIRESLALDKTNPNESQYKHLLANTYNNLGDLHRKTEDFGEAKKLYQQALDIYDELTQKDSKEQKYQNGLAASYMGLGILFQDTGNTSEANDYIDKAVDKYEQLKKSYPETLKYQGYIVISLNHLGNARFNRNNVEAKNFYKMVADSHDSLEKKFKDSSNIPEYKDVLASSYGNLGNVESKNGKVAEALESYNKAIATQEQLKKSYSDVPEYQNHLAYSYYSRGDLLGTDGKKPNKEAQDSYGKAEKIWEELVKNHPDIPEYKRNLITTLGNRAWQSLLLGEAHEASTDAEKALKQDPDQTWIKVNRFHGLLLDNNYPKALEIYKENKDAKLDDGRTFAQAVLDDFKQFRKNKNYLDREENMAKIEKLLRDPKTKKHH